MSKLKFLALAPVVAILTVAAARHRAVMPPPIPAPVAGPTFDREVVRIFQQNCQTCHHPGDIAPFSLMTYAEAIPHAFEIKANTSAHIMPPWKPVGSCGEFNAPRTLSAEDIATIAAWVNNGAPEGNAADLPQPLDFSSGWTLGDPDLVLGNSKPFTPPADRDEYRCFSMPTNITSDHYVSAIDVHPGDRATVHHVIAFIDTTGESAKLDTGDGYQCFGGPGFSITNLASSALGGWAPGTRPDKLPDNVGYLLPANSRIVLQVHYHPHDPNPKPDSTQIGLYYDKVKPAQTMLVLPLINQNFTIPPGDSNYKVPAAFTNTLFNAHLWFIAPHMHLLGRRMNVDATMPNGSTQCLVNISDWDFNWQGMYRYKTPIAIPVGTRFSLSAYYDNSADNPRNPNSPPRAVSWGEATTDEMCIAFIGVTLDNINPTASTTVSELGFK
jgi:mono/diheme cytochrome c family protein